MRSFITLVVKSGKLMLVALISLGKNYICSELVLVVIFGHLLL